MTPESRRPEELNSVTDCVEEILFAMQITNTFGLMATAIERGSLGVDLYDRVEEIVRRAQTLPLQDASGSQPPSE